MDRVWELILSDGGWMALALTALIVLVLAPLARMFQKLGSRDDMSDKAIVTQAVTLAELSAASIESQKSQNESLHLISEAMDRMSRVIEKQQTQIDDINQRTDSISQRTDFLKADLGTAVADMRVSATALSDRVGDVPQKVREVVVPEIEKIPAAIEAILTPKFDTLQLGVENVIRELDIKLKQASKDITNETERTFNNQLSSLRDELMALFRESLADAVKSIVVVEPTTDAAQPAEEKPNE